MIFQSLIHILVTILGCCSYMAIFARGHLEPKEQKSGEGITTMSASIGLGSSAYLYEGPGDPEQMFMDKIASKLLGSPDNCWQDRTVHQKLAELGML